MHGKQLIRQVNKIIDHVAEGGLYNYWISLELFGVNYYFGR